MMPSRYFIEKCEVYADIISGMKRCQAWMNTQDVWDYTRFVKLKTCMVHLKKRYNAFARNKIRTF